jgi:glycosyltransferase involved in cell wall biosynthesis
MKAPQHRPLTVLFLSNDCGFPNGLAGAQRMRLVARALTEAGIRVRVLLTWTSEWPPFISNTAASGEWRGISFQYSTGTPIRSDSFVMRRWSELRGIAGAVVRLVSGRLTGDIDCVYIWMFRRRWVPFRMLRGLCALLGLPVVIELNEPTAAVCAGASLSDGAGRRDALLANVDGFVVISDGLERWVRSRAGGDKPAIVRVPVLIDKDETAPGSDRHARNDVFYAVGAAYVDEIEFVVDAVEEARRTVGDLRVRFSGWDVADIPRPLLRERLESGIAEGWAVVEGRVPRERLLEAYRQSAALLLPMKDEPRSFARCPTKLGEYLASGRPVVATDIGELAVLLIDGQTTFLAKPGDVQSFAEGIVRALEDPGLSDRIGRAGRTFAEEHLDFRGYSESLGDFFIGVCQRRRRSSGPLSGRNSLR